MRQSSLARRAFEGLHPNFMTPSTIGYYSRNGIAIELSTGAGLDNQPIFGVTTRHLNGDSLGDKDKSKLFQSESEALAYIRTL